MRLSCECRHRFPSGFALEVAFETTARICGLAGPSGSGKSSIVRMLAGVWRPEFARAVRDGHLLIDTTGGRFVAPHERMCGVVFQDSHLFPHLTVSANLDYAARRARGPVRIERAAVIDLLRLDALLPRRPATLSGGERQRVAIGRALLTQPALLLLDEPLAAVDAEHRVEILDALERIVATWDVPLLLVSHDQADLRRLAEEVVILRGGVVRGQGGVELLSDPRIESGGQVLNVLRLERDPATPTTARLGTALLQLPPRLHGTGPTVYASVSSGAIALGRTPAHDVSIRNSLGGRVLEIVEEAGVRFVRVTLEDGQTLWVAVTPAAVADLSLEPGREVCCLVKTHALGPLG